MVVHGRVMWTELDSRVELDNRTELDNRVELDSRAELDNQTELDNRAELDSRAALVLAGRTFPGRTEIVQVLQLVAAGNAEEWW